MTNRPFIFINILITVIVMILICSGCFNSTPNPSYSIQRLIDPSISSEMWVWDKEMPKKATSDSQDTIIYNVAFEKVCRNAIILEKQGKYTCILDNPGSGKLEFWSAAIDKNNEALPGGASIQITLNGRKKSISEKFSITYINSPDLPWIKYEMPVINMFGQIECTFEYVMEEQAMPKESSVFIATPVFIPDDITPLPNVVLIVIDSLRPDELGAYGSPLANSPTIDMLSKQGILYSQSLSTSSWTIPSVKNLLAGYITQLEQPEGNFLTLADGFTGTMIQELYAEAGYYTSAVIANPLVTSKFSFEKGFDEFDTFAAQKHIKGSGKLLSERIDDISNHLKNKPFFLFVHFMDPHDPYLPDSPFNLMNPTPSDNDVRKKIHTRSSGILNLEPHKSELLPLTESESIYLRNHYRNEIREVDTFLHLSLLSLHQFNLFPENTLIIVTADHGEEFGEHGFYQHGMSLHEASVRVPWIMSFPQSLPVKHIEPGWVSTMDIPPTLSNLTLNKWIPSWTGFSLYPKSSDYPENRRGFTVVRSSDDTSIPRVRWRAVYQGDKKLVWTPSELKAFNLGQNPEEQVLFRFPTSEMMEKSSWEKEWGSMRKDLEYLIENVVIEEKHKIPHALMMQLKELGYVN